MYIKYKKISNDKTIIVNVNLSSCTTIETEGQKLIIKMSDGSKDNTKTFDMGSNEKAIEALDFLFETLHYKSPAGNLLDLTNMDKKTIEEETNMREE